MAIRSAIVVTTLLAICGSAAAQDAPYWLPRYDLEIKVDVAGRNVQVRVLLHGFAYDGNVYPSLSAVAHAITGSHCNGYQFFRLSPTGGADA